MKKCSSFIFSISILDSVSQRLFLGGTENTIKYNLATQVMLICYFNTHFVDTTECTRDPPGAVDSEIQKN